MTVNTGNYLDRCDAVVEEVQILELKLVFSNFYSAKLRAKVVTASNNCRVLAVKGRVLKNGGMVLTPDHTMVEDTANSDWWITSGSITFFGVSPGDVIYAAVDATWVCQGDVSDVPSPYYPIP